jgi:trans-aconitate methyltransferase
MSNVHDDNWDAHWEQYAASASQNPAQQMRHRVIAGLLAAHKVAAPKVFDIGSGQGDFMVKVDAMWPDAALLGAELSESGVEISRRKVPRAQFLVADLFHPPEALQSYQGWATHAVCSEVLEHVDDPVAFLRQARPYLAPGAELIVTVPGGPMSEFDRVIGHRGHFTRAFIRQILQDAGFEVQRVCMAGFPFFNLYRLTVIARGKKLAEDVRASQHGSTSKLAAFIMATFRALFRFNLLDSPFGWQVVAVARKPLT